MASENRFQIVFDKLSEAVSEHPVPNRPESRKDDLRKASDEIAELMRAVLELSERPVSLFTTT
jgi:hypothetical protein